MRACPARDRKNRHTWQAHSPGLSSADCLEKRHETIRRFRCSVFLRGHARLMSFASADESRESAPGGLHDSEGVTGNLWICSTADIADLRELSEGDRGFAPGAGHDVEAIGRKVKRRLTRLVVMPVANHNVFRHEVDG